MADEEDQGLRVMPILAIYITAAWVWLFVAGLAMVPL